jgi:DNA modification methylase
MTPFYADPHFTLYCADAIEIMRELPAESVDAVVTDPPYGLEFMGKEWDRLIHVHDDHTLVSEGRTVPKFQTATPRYQAGKPMQAWHEVWAREAFRLLKPGGHLLSFGGTRTYHRLACAIEDAGFEIRDCLVWGYASGFPKSLDVGKAIDAAAGAQREVVGKSARHIAKGEAATSNLYAQDEWTRQNGKMGEFVTAPATDDAKRWDGWGTALKPAWEPIVMARKPLRGTVAANVLAYGTGALNIDATRIGTPETAGKPRGQVSGRTGDNGIYGSFAETGGSSGDGPTSDAGRWPANVVLTDPIFDGGIDGVVGGGEASPGTAAGVKGSSGFVDGYDGNYTVPYGDTGTYSRFFLVAKSSRSDREPLITPEGHDRSKRFSTHPTQKPTELMRHLVRLVTPPGGLVLDPFLGSGTTAIAANAEGFRAIGIEKEREYVEITVARLAGQPLGMGLADAI